MKQLVTSMFFTLALLLPLGQAQAADEEIRALAKEVSDKILARTDKRRAELKAHPERLPDALRTADDGFQFAPPGFRFLHLARVFSCQFFIELLDEVLAFLR